MPFHLAKSFIGMLYFWLEGETYRSILAVGTQAGAMILKCES